jgi:Domain of unknown function (DUF6745)
MVSIGSCDICGEFCADDEENFATAEYHYRLSERLHDCDERHLGPWHDRRGRPLDRCDWCAELAEYYGTDNALDHSDCRLCRAERPMLPLPVPRDWHKRTPLRTEPRVRIPSARHSLAYAETDGIREGLHADLTSTEPVDRRRVERALRIYLGRKRVRIEWYRSPRALGARFAAAVEAGGLELPLSEADVEPWSLWNMAPAALRQRVADPYTLSGRGAAGRVVNEVRQRALAMASAVEDLAAPEGSGVFPPLATAGQFDVVSRLQDVLDGFDDVTPVADGGFLALMAELRASAGPVLAFDGVFHVLERPLVLRLDEETRLHCEDGPAMAYPDGTEVWAIHGVVLSREVVLYPERLTVADIEGQSNTEIRRVMVERFGAERLLREGGAELIDEDATGRLWRWQPVHPVGRPWEPVVMVEVDNATPEPDGTFRRYFLRVPPEIRSARAAVAWTFHLEAGQYHPAQQT